VALVKSLKSLKSANSVFFDTSVLVAGTIDFGPPSVASLKVLGAFAREGVGPPLTAWHCCLEFYAVTTRLPPEYRLCPAQALQVLEDDVLRKWRVSDLSEAHRASFLGTLSGERVVGGRLYDAHIAAIAHASGAATVVTENRRHFTSLMRYGIRVLDAAEIAREMGLK